MTSWGNLKHAYGIAEDIPGLLEQLAFFPEESSFEKGPWFTLWSNLYHQGDIFTASIAAVPEIVSILSGNPVKATASFFSLPASIEVARFKSGIEVPAELKSSYHEAIKQLGSLAALNKYTDSGVSRAALAAIAASSDLHSYAELILEVSIEEVSEVLNWYWDR